MPIPAVLKRVTSAVVLIPAFVWLVARGPVWLFDVVVVGLSGVAAWELAQMLAGAERATPTPLTVAGAAAVTASFALTSAPLALPYGPVVVLTLALATAMAAPLWGGRRPALEPMTATVLTVTYVGWFLGHGLLLRRLPDGAMLILVVVGVTWIGETAAYGVGSTLGRRALAPLISPRKTLEGAAAQAVASVLSAMLLGAWLLPGWDVARTAGAGLLMGVVGQVGDLVESAVKRSLGTKDAGQLIPGHGGLLDRLDGLLFNVPAIVYYVWLVGARA